MKWNRYPEVSEVESLIRTFLWRERGIRDNEGCKWEDEGEGKRQKEGRKSEIRGRKGMKRQKLPERKRCIIV